MSGLQKLTVLIKTRELERSQQIPRVPKLAGCDKRYSETAVEVWKKGRYWLRFVEAAKTMASPSCMEFCRGKLGTGCVKRARPLLKGSMRLRIEEVTEHYKSKMHRDANGAPWSVSSNQPLNCVRFSSNYVIFRLSISLTRLNKQSQASNDLAGVKSLV